MLSETYMAIFFPGYVIFSDDNLENMIFHNNHMDINIIHY